MAASSRRAPVQKARPKTGSRPGPSLLAPVAVLLLAALVRAVAWRFQPYVTYDGTAYIAMARDLLAGRVAPSVYAPGYPAAIALALAGLRDGVLGAALVSFVAGLLLPAVVWFVAKRAVGERWALVPMLLVALHPELCRFSVLSMSESTFLALVYLACALADRGLASGALAGAAYAVRPEGLVLFAGLALRHALRAVRRLATARVLLLCLACGMLVIAPCILYYRAGLGVWTLTPKVEAFRAPTQDWRQDEPRRSVRAPAPLEQRLDAWKRWEEHGPELVRAWPRNAVQTARELAYLWPIPLLLLSAWGLAIRRGPDTLPLLQLLLLPWLGLSFQPRFALVCVPALAIAAVVPLALVRPRAARLAAQVLLGVGFVAELASSGAGFVTPFDGNLDSARRAGAWLGHSLPAGSTILDRKPFLAYYAGGKFRILPDDPYDEVVDDAVRSGVGALVIEEQLVHGMRPQFAPLVLDPEALASEKRLELIYIGGEQPSYGLVIFRVLRPGEPKSGRRPFEDIVRR